MKRVKVDWFPKNIQTLHYYALTCSAASEAVWDLRKYLTHVFPKRFILREKANSIIIYDRLINNEVSVDMFQKMDQTRF